MTDQTNTEFDEIEQFQYARCISPPEVVWRIYRYPMHEISPAIISLQLHLDGCQMCTFRKHTRLKSIAENEFSKKKTLAEFFWMNANDPQAKATKYFYKDFPASFVWNKQSKTWKARQQKDVIGRIVSANPNEGERYFIRLLLTHIPGATSYMDLQTINGIIYSTFREAAIAHGILEDDQSKKKHVCNR